MKNVFKSTHSDLITNDESMAESNLRNLNAMIEGGFKYKLWLTSRDKNVCDQCAKMDGEVVSMNEAFSNGLIYPGEKQCSKGCRCTLIPTDIK